MTKEQELAILDKAIDALGKDTYCGPWLATVRDEVEREIRSDYFPDFSIVACQRECEELKKQTEAACMALRDKAAADTTLLRINSLRKADDVAAQTAANFKKLLREAVWAGSKILETLP